MPDYLPSGHFVDVSHYDDANIDLHAYAASGCRLIVVKSTEGAGYTDPTFGDFAARVRSVPGLALGTYVFEDAAAEAPQIAHYLNVAHLQKGDVQPIVDAEALGLTRTETFDALDDLANRGYEPICYCNRSFYETVLGSPVMVYDKPFRLWLAYYADDLPTLPDGLTLFAWQHSQNAQWPNINVPVDANYLYGDLDDYLIA